MRGFSFMWHWKNNGPGPPYDPDEVVVLIAAVCDLLAYGYFLRWVLLSTYDAYRVWKHIVR